jgi:ABC-type transport system involved in cytochrome bd biosynthesis fused ATPase/permease subunit
MPIHSPQELQFEQQLEDYKHGLASQREAAQGNHEAQLEQYKTREAIHLVSFKATLEFGTYASRAMLLLPGAAAIALLAYLGSNNATKEQATLLAPCLATFAVAAFFAVLGMGFTYLAQVFFTYATRQRRNHSPTGYTFQVVAIVAWLLAAGLFVFGLWRTARVFSGDFNLWSVLGL